MPVDHDDGAGGAPARSGPLAGVRVLDLTTVILGPFATQILAQLGAEVIKVESTEGDNMRHVGPMRSAGMGHIFLHANAGKQCIALNLKDAQAREAVLRLAAQVDVFISNIRPNALARLGLDHDTLRAINPRLIHVSCCGFDQQGPDAARPAYDDLIQGAVGIPWLMQQYGSPEPAYAPVTLCDRVTGLHAVYATTAALYARERTGMGQQIVVPMFEAMTQFVLGDHLAGLGFEPPAGPAGYPRLLTPHRRPYRTQDGMLCVMIYNDKHWRSFFQALADAPDGSSHALATDARFATHTARAQHIDEVYGEIVRLMATRTTAQWQALLDAHDIPNMPMNDPHDLLNDPQLRATGFVHEQQHPTEGTLHVMAHPTRWSGTEPARTMPPVQHLGQSTRDVLRALGFSDADVDAMQARGACVAR